MSKDIIYKQAAIDVVKRLMGDCELSRTVQTGLHILPSAQQDLNYIIFETLAECGIYGEEATVKFIGTLKRLGRNDLLPPCAR